MKSGRVAKGEEEEKKRREKKRKKWHWDIYYVPESKNNPLKCFEC